MKKSITSLCLLLGVGLGSNSLLGQVSPVPAKPAGPDLSAAGKVARCKASALIGCAVTNDKNESLGEVEDIVLDHDNRKIAYVAVCYGGVLGMGERCFAMPWRVLEIAQRSPQDNPRLTLGLDPALLKAGPGFDKSAWPDVANAAWAQRVDDYYVSRKDKPVGENAEAAKRGKVEGVPAPASAVAGKPSAYRRVTKLIGMDVRDDKGVRIATVEDVVLETKAAVIDGIVVSFGGTLGIGEAMALVPTEALVLNQEKGDFRFACGKSTLERLTLEGGVMPALDAADWLVRAREVCAKATAEAGVGNGHVAGEAAAPPATLFADVYDVDAVRTVQGTIATVGSVCVGTRAEERVRIRMRTDDGEEVVVYAAPASFKAQSALGLRVGRVIAVSGATARHGHQSVLLASSVTCGGKTATLRDAKGKVAWEAK